MIDFMPMRVRNITVLRGWSLFRIFMFISFNISYFLNALFYIFTLSNEITQSTLQLFNRLTKVAGLAISRNPG